jgi:hypothetical protein
LRDPVRTMPPPTWRWGTRRSAPDSWTVGYRVDPALAGASCEPTTLVFRASCLRDAPARTPHNSGRTVRAALGDISVARRESAVAHSCLTSSNYEDDLPPCPAVELTVDAPSVDTGSQGAIGGCVRRTSLHDPARPDYVRLDPYPAPRQDPRCRPIALCRGGGISICN